MKRSCLFLILILILVSCNKNEENSYTTKLFINSTIKSLVFKPGSYWIYISDSAQQTDCTYVQQMNYGSYDIGYGLDRYVSFEYYSLVYVSSSPDGQSSYINHIETNHMLLNPIIGYPWASGPVLFTYDTTFDWKNFPSTNKYIDSLKVENNTFYRVQESKFTLNSHSNAFYTDANIGLVRKDITVDSAVQQWNLIKWHIVK